MTGILLELFAGWEAENCQRMLFFGTFAGYDAVIYFDVSLVFAGLGSFDLTFLGRFACAIILSISNVQSIGIRTRFDLLILTA